MIRIAQFWLALSAVMSLFLVYLIFEGSALEQFREQGQILMSLRWGQISLVDLYAGFFLGLAILWLLEPNLWIRIGLSIALPLVGNPVLVAWLIIRFGLVKQRLTDAAS